MWPSVAVSFVLLAALWVSTASTVSVGEIIAGLGAAFLASAGFGLTVRVMNVRPEFGARELACATKLVFAIFRDTAVVLAHLVSRTTPSQLREYHFDAAITRFRPVEFWVVLFGSFTPDSIVVDFDPAKRGVCVRQVYGRSAPGAIRCLGVQ
jgi:hypothetical protein